MHGGARRSTVGLPIHTQHGGPHLDLREEHFRRRHVCRIPSSCSRCTERGSARTRLRVLIRVDPAARRRVKILHSAGYRYIGSEKAHLGGAVSVVSRQVHGWFRGRLAHRRFAKKVRTPHVACLFCCVVPPDSKAYTRLLTCTKGASTRGTQPAAAAEKPRTQRSQRHHANQCYDLRRASRLIT